MEEIKRSLQQIFKIFRWNPTNAQVELIIRHFERMIKENKRITFSDGQSIISKYCPNAMLDLFEGKDNSDLNTLLTTLIKKFK